MAKEKAGVCTGALGFFTLAFGSLYIPRRSKDVTLCSPESAMARLQALLCGLTHVYATA